MPPAPPDERTAPLGAAVTWSRGARTWPAHGRPLPPPRCARGRCRSTWEAPGPVAPRAPADHAVARGSAGPWPHACLRPARSYRERNAAMNSPPPGHPAPVRLHNSRRVQRAQHEPRTTRARRGPLSSSGTEPKPVSREPAQTSRTYPGTRHPHRPFGHRALAPGPVRTPAPDRPVRPPGADTRAAAPTRCRLGSAHPPRDVRAPARLRCRALVLRTPTHAHPRPHTPAYPTPHARAVRPPGARAAPGAPYSPTATNRQTVPSSSSSLSASPGSSSSSTPDGSSASRSRSQTASER